LKPRGACAFLGLGAMGRPLARRLAIAGWEVHGWNRTAKPFPELDDAGVRLHRVLTDAIRTRQTIFTCLLDEHASREVISSALPNLPPDAVLVDLATIGVSAAREIATMASRAGAKYLDAPVSGGVPRAEAGSLTVMVGGDARAFQAVLPMLEDVAALVRHMGPTGSGQATKLVNQLLTAAHQLAAAEALLLGTALGLEVPALHEILTHSYGASRILERSIPHIASRSYTSTFRVRLLAKDLALLKDASEELGLTLPATEATRRSYEDALKKGWGNRDAAIVFELLAAKRTLPSSNKPFKPPDATTLQ
jgi:3-hydroxyisobutyrate dehydrogenase